MLRRVGEEQLKEEYRRLVEREDTNSSHTSVLHHQPCGVCVCVCVCLSVVGACMCV